MERLVTTAITLSLAILLIFGIGNTVKNKATKVVDSIGFTTVFSELDKALE